MTIEPDFTDQLNAFALKHGMESEAMFRLQVKAERQRTKVAALREALYEVECDRAALIRDLVPFMPEPAPVPLYEAPSPIQNGNGHHWDVHGDDLPAFINGGRG